ncbi:hypothetical protein F4703DRAFT_1539113 [Phycomyces blakesleeanus]
MIPSFFFSNILYKKVRRISLDSLKLYKAFSNFCQRIQQIQTCKTTLITRYILHEIQPLFDDHKRDIRLEFGFIGYSDCIITVFPHHTDNGMNAGYDEVKRQSRAGSHCLVNLDLVRLATLGKRRKK